MITLPAKAARRPTTHPRPTNSRLIFTAIVVALICAATNLSTRTATAQDATWVNSVNGAIAVDSVEKKGGKFATFISSSIWNVLRGRNDLSSAPLATAPIASPVPTPAGEVVWVEDAVPTGSAAVGDNEGWNWVSSNPAPFSGLSAHQSGIYSGWHQHFFYGATTTLAVNAGDTLFTYVYLDPNNLPGEVMLQWNDGTWEHRAYWGANNIPWGTDGTNSRRYMGALPPAGQWVRLEVPASQVGLEGHTLNGMAFTLYGGRATWDRAGKSSNGTPMAGVSVNANPVSTGATLNLYTDETILFDASASVGAYTHLWDFGDGASGLKATTPKVAYGYRSTGTRTVTYKACNSAGECSQLTFSITAAARTFNPPGTTYTSLGALQTAIDADTGGSDFVLAPGNYGGTLKLSKRTGAMTRIRCASGYGLPEVRTSESAGMCVITANENGQPALTTMPTTGNSAPINNYLIEGFAFKFMAGANNAGIRVSVVRLGFENETFAQLPTNITLRHCHISIPDDANAAQGIAPNARHVAVLDSTVKNIHYAPNGAHEDAQAIWCWHGMYGLWVDNCFLNADTEVAGAGGSFSPLTQRPEAITYRRTHFYKPEAWTNSASWWNKNIFELKTGRSVNVDACILETTDGDNTQGFPITLTAYRDTDGRNDTIQDVSFTRLKIKNTPGFASVCSDCGQRPGGLGGLGGPSGGEVRRVSFEDIVLDNQENTTRTGQGRFILLQTYGTDASPIDRLSFNRITAPLNYSGDVAAFLFFSVHPNRLMTNFSFTNVVGNSVVADVHSGAGKGSVALAANTSGGYTWAGNVIAGITLNPPNASSNQYPASRNDIGFVNLNGGIGGDYRLSSSSSYKTSGVNNSRPGADIDAIDAATQGVISGVWQQSVSSTNVNWVNLTSSTLTGTTIGQDGGSGVGHAESMQSLTSGDGSFEFTVMQIGNYWGAGLNSGAKASSYGALEYAIVFRGTTNAEILESGNYRGEVPVQVNDVLKVAVESGKVKYYRIRGGSSLLVYTNETPAVTYPLKANAIFLSTSSSIKDGVVTGFSN